jgi:peptidoglycan/LPS O-acetylase OafA/YrhL
VNSGQDVDGLKISRRPVDMGLEGVRGIAAVFVALSHVLYQKILAPDVHLSPILGHVEAGHAGVLVFFVLSGYVISWTNTASFSADSAKSYVRRRFVRLVPIYVIAMLITILAIPVAGYPESARVIVGSFLGLQNFNGYFGFSLNPPVVNGPLWSLNYELLYYALFLLLWRNRPALSWVFIPALLSGIVAWFTPQFMPLFIASYGCGWVFWASGWWLSMQPRDEGGARESGHAATWILLIFANHQINGLARVLNTLHFYSNDAGMVNIADLGLLPAVLLALAAVTRRKLPGRGILMFSAWAVCIIPIAGMIWTGRLASHPNWIVGAVSVGLAALLLPVRSDRWLRPFAWFGGISYAFYVVHFPLLYLVQHIPVSGGTPAAFVERLALWIAATLGISWLLEKRFQPWIKARLFRVRPANA